MAKQKRNAKHVGDYLGPLILKEKSVRRRMKGLRWKYDFSYIAYSPEMKSFLRKNGGVFVLAYNLIEKNLENFNRGKRKSISNNNVRIRRLSRDGFPHSLFFKVTIGEFQFFVKRAPYEDDRRNMWALKNVEKYLAKKNYLIGGFNIRVIKPLLVYSKNRERYKTEKNPPPVYTVLDFYGRDEAIAFSDDSRKYKKQNDVLYSLFTKLSKKGGDDIGARNAFYVPSTNTILLFDLGSPPAATHIY